MNDALAFKANHSATELLCQPNPLFWREMIELIEIFKAREILAVDVKAGMLGDMPVDRKPVHIAANRGEGHSGKEPVMIGGEPVGNQVIKTLRACRHLVDEGLEDTRPIAVHRMTRRDRNRITL